MKKFNFSLQKMLNYREQLLETERNALGQLRARLTEIESHILKLASQLEEMQSDYGERARQGMYAVELSEFSYKLSGAREYQKVLESNRVKVAQAVELQRQSVVRASQEVEKLEKLKEKQLEEYKYAEQKAFNEEISEQIVIKLARESAEPQ